MRPGEAAGTKRRGSMGSPGSAADNEPRRPTAAAVADMAAMEDDADTWIGWFCSQKGNEFLCEVEASFIGELLAQQRLSHRASRAPRGCMQPSVCLYPGVRLHAPIGALIAHAEQDDDRPVPDAAIAATVIVASCWPVLFALPATAEDAFNLYGLRSMVPHFRDCIEMILDIRSGEAWRIEAAVTLHCEMHSSRWSDAPWQGSKIDRTDVLLAPLQGRSATARTGAERCSSTREICTG